MTYLLPALRGRGAAWRALESTEVTVLNRAQAAEGFAALALPETEHTEWNLSGSLRQELALLALKQALRHNVASDIHHSDQGTQYAAKVYVQLLRDAGTQFSMAAIGKPSENGYAERVIRTIKEEEVYLSVYRNMADAKQQIGHFIDVVYKHKRICSALDYMTPAEFEAGWNQNPPSNPAFAYPAI